MRLEVQYPDGPPHEVELQGTLAILGRDPSCDLVLNDVKCSRRHAVIEAGPDGLAIRDTGSANGVFVNGQKADRAALKPGDRVRLGDVSLTVLADEVPGTVIMGPGEVVVDVDATPRPFPPPRARPAPPLPPTQPFPPASRSAPLPPVSSPSPLPPSPPSPTPPLTPRQATDTTAPVSVTTAGAAPAGRRPGGVTTLAILWALSAPTYAIVGLAWAIGSHGVARGLIGAGSMLLAIVCLVMAFALWTLQPWGRVLQIVIAAVGLLVCPFTLASGVALAYALRSSTRRAFGGSKGETPEAPAPAGKSSSAEALFAGGLIAAVLLGVFLSVLAAIAVPSFIRAREAARERQAAVFIDETGHAAV